MNEAVIVALIGAAVTVVAAVVAVWVRSRKSPEISDAAQFVPSEAHNQSLKLGVIVATGLVAESQDERGIEQSLVEAKKVAAVLARLMGKGSHSFGKGNDFNALVRALERFFVPPDLVAYRLYYELGQALGNFKMAGKNSQIIQMTLNYIFVNCASDFSRPFSKLPLTGDLQQWLTRLYDIQTSPHFGNKEIHEIAQEVEKVWIVFFGRKV